MLPRNMHHVSRNMYIIKRFLSGNVTNKPATVLQSKIQREDKYILPFKHFLQISGNEISSRICDAFNYWLDIPKDKVKEILGITNTMHISILLFDDIIDNATLRRKIPAAHTIFTLGNTIATANLIQLDALQAAEHLGHPDAMKTIVKYLADLYEGQAMELYWSENAYTPTEEEYERCLLYKTGGLFWIPIKLMELFSKQKYDFNPLMKSFSKYFQTRDDYYDMGIQNIKCNKTNTILHDDISAGTYTYPIIHALRNNPDDFQIHRILQLRTHDNNIKRHLISLLEKYGSLEHTRNVVNKLEKEVRDEIEKLGDNPIFTETMDFFNSIGVSTK